MATSITNAFIGDYNADVHHVFQREGSMLKPAVYEKSGVVGSTAYFEKLGTGTATTKSRHGTITPMNVNHTQPSATLLDFYAGDWVDKLDEAKTNIEVQRNYARAGAYALGRRLDEELLTTLDTTTQSVVTFAVTSAAAIQASLLGMAEALDSNGVPNDGMRYAILSPRAYAQAMTVESFASADYVGSNGLPFENGAPGHRRWRDWMGIKWGMHNANPGVGTATSKVFAWHKNAMGLAIAKSAGNVASNEAVAADITWHGDRAAHFINHMMSFGTVMIDDTGVIEAQLDDTAAIATS